MVGKRQSIATEQDKSPGLIALFHQAILTDLVSPSCSLSILRRHPLIRVCYRAIIVY